MGRRASRWFPRLAEVLPLAWLAAMVIVVPGAGGDASAGTRSGTESTIAVVNLTTDYQVNPLGDDASTPRLGWQLMSSTDDQSQRAYQVRVWIGADESNGVGPVWDSGRVTSPDQVDVAYAGPAPRAATRYQWQVRIWDAFGRSSAWSPPAWWETGLGSATAGWSGAQWISAGPGSDAPLLRKELTLVKPVASARIYVFGLGWDELHLNGSKVGTRVLTPANTQYGQSDLYDTYDVTREMHQGPNAVGIWLGSGYGPTYSPYGWRWLGPKQAIAKITIRFRDGTSTTMVTDDSWKWSDGPIVANDIYNGETFDARLDQTGWDTPGFDAGRWHATQVVAPPSGALSATSLPPIQVVNTITPVKLSQPGPGTYVFDLGQNIAGWARLRVAGAGGTRVRLRYSEDLGIDGMIDQRTNRSASATDVYILAGGDSVQAYEPRFTYHGFRFIEVTGYPGVPDLASLDGRVVHADVVAAGTFHSSDPVLNQIHANSQRTMLNNSMSIPTDTPVRDERTPAAMDVQAYSEAAAIDFGMDNFYGNYLADLAGRGLGTSGYFTSGASPDMNGTPVHLAWTLYLEYGDISRLELLYPSLKAYVDSLSPTAPDGIQPDVGFGDWCPPAPAGGSGLGGPTAGGYNTCLSERSLVNTALYYHDAELIARMANVLGDAGDAASYQALARRIGDAFNRHFQNATRDGYGDGRQATSAIPLAFGLVPVADQAAVAGRLASTVLTTNGGHLDTGIFGTPSLVSALCAAGNVDLALDVLTRPTYPGFGYQLSLGATTTWEEWPYQTLHGDPRPRHVRRCRCIPVYRPRWDHPVVRGLRSHPHPAHHPSGPALGRHRHPYRPGPRRIPVGQRRQFPTADGTDTGQRRGRDRRAEESRAGVQDRRPDRGVLRASRGCLLCLLGWVWYLHLHSDSCGP